MAVSIALGLWASAMAADTNRMWRELDGHCNMGGCSLAEGSRLSSLANTTDCKGRLLAYEYGLTLIPSRDPQLESFDALQLATTCGVTRPAAAALAPPPLVLAPASLSFVVSPGESIPAALARAQAADPRAKKNIVLKPGVHFLDATIKLGAADSGVTITAAPGSKPGSVIVSGGMPLAPTWKKSTRQSTAANVIWETPVPAALRAGFKGLTTLDPHRRVTRARYPNAGPSQGAELCTDCWTNGVVRWHHNTSCVGKAATVYRDLRDCDNDMKLPSGLPCKNDSAMWDTYNTYSNGHGGCCAAWSGDHSPYGPMGNYFCGNSSAGGWIGYNDPRGMPGLSGISGVLDNDSQITYAEYNGSQGLSAQLPWGFDYDPGKHPILDTIASPAGAILHVWRDQGWFVNMFELDTIDAETHAVRFATAESRGWTHPKGGWQGGRGWQIGNASQINDTDATNYLTGGKWMVENFWEALDEENEWFYDEAKETLYLIPNATTAGDLSAGNITAYRDGVSGAPRESYVAVVLETLIAINGTKEAPVKDVTVQGITFRDAADITMNPWGVPSGGDWGLYRGGAIFVEGVEDVTIQHNTLTRLDGNAVFVSGYTRNVTIADNEFSWIGCNPMASWGYTNETDGMDGLQPRYTNVLRNYVHEIGHYEKQSSMWSNNKACLARVEGNVVFNGPRAGINFNDGFGGGTNVSMNLIYNQCRESGDHGAMNAWDRTAYISDVKYGTPSYEAQMNSVNNNFIIANYGASQGFDTDDGSSWYDIHDNFFFMADGWKMDYGGHDSKFTDNVVYHAHNDGQNCFNTWPFLPGHGCEWTGNRCILWKSLNLGNPGDGIVPALECPGPGKSGLTPWIANETTTDTWRAQCGLTLANNKYHTSNVTGTSVNANCPVDPSGSNNCGNRRGMAQPSFEDWTKKYGNDRGSTLEPLPSDEQLLAWAREKLGM